MNDNFAANAAMITMQTTPPMPPPPRIDRLSLHNFRAFPGPTDTHFQFDGKNLLVYGENGSGKSSIFHALNEFFSIQGTAGSRATKLEAYANKFSGLWMHDTWVEVSFNDSTERRWDTTTHPADTRPTAHAPTVNAAYRKAMLDYRSLLDTNYSHGDDPVNLFDVCVNAVLRDFRTAHGGSEQSLYELWQSLKEYINPAASRNWAAKARIDLTRSFNDGLASILEHLLPKMNDFLSQLGWQEVTVTALRFPRLAYNNKRLLRDRGFTGCSITPEIEFRGSSLERPHHFLNEARLSALALAMYFAGRSICGNTVMPGVPKIMVLDDVLIGLDQSNRLPVLKLLTEHFADWQIVLLTHDRVWFETARMYLPDADWSSLEMFEGAQADGTVRPIIRPKNMNVIADNLALAKSFLTDHHDNAAALHCRMAFEQSLKKFCERKGVPVAFKANAKDLTTENLLNAIDAWLGGASRAPQKAALDPHLVAARSSRSVVLNPYSHSTPVTLVTSEIQTAIAAVETLEAELKKAFPK
jgi:energy-coupling factor transporter ATP-binding protein EcfA2